MAPQAQQQDRSSNGRTYDFKPISFDGNAIEPDVAAGAYVFVVEAAKVGKSKNDSFPQVIIEWKADELLDPDNATDEQSASVGGVMTEWITFFPEGDKRGKMGKVRYRELCDKLNVGYDIVSNPKSKADFDAFLDKLRGARLDGWVSRKDGDSFGRITNTEPKGGGTQLAPLEEVEEEAPRARSGGGGGGKKAAPARGSRR